MFKNVRWGFAVVAMGAALSLSATAQLDERLGKLSFPTSCAPSVQTEFERGVAMIHSYWFNYARKTFEGVLKQDPNCAIAYWGLAADLLGNTLVGPPSRKDAEVAWQHLEKGRAGNAKTERERDWIEALSAYFRDHDKVAVNKRLALYNDAMERLTKKYPDDYEAWVFYALTLQASASHSDTTYAQQLKSAAILEKLYEDNPQHPGVTHFIIHAYDFAPLADKGIPAARRYAGIAPAVPHARHMPSHIYSMVGLWEESIKSNELALEIQPDYYHAADFGVYAHLQLAQDVKAKALADRSIATADRGDRPITFVNYTARAAMPARYVLERGDWKGAATLTPTKSDFPQADPISHFARGIGAARSGDLAAAKQEIELIAALRKKLQAANQSYWAERSEDQMLAISAWVAFEEGQRDQALKLMRAAAESEDRAVKHVAMENRLYPFRELLADLLLELNESAAALQEYETALRDNRNRFRGYWGAARAADAAGNRQKASDYLRRLVELAKNADSDRPEIRQAKAILSGK